MRTIRKAITAGTFAQLHSAIRSRWATSTISDREKTCYSNDTDSLGCFNSWK